MLRVTVSKCAPGAVVVVEGRLAGPWVEELDTCWQQLTAASDPSSIRVELKGVTFIDPAGKALLRCMCEQGTVLSTREVMTREIVDDIVRAASEHRLTRS